MNDEEIKEKVFASVLQKLERDGTRLTIGLSLDTTFEELDFDSLDGADFLCYLSDRLGLEVPEQVLYNFGKKASRDYLETQLRDVVNYVQENQACLQPVSSRQ